VNRGHSSCNGLRGRRLFSATLALVLLTMGLASGAAAQRIGTTPGGIGGGAGVIGPTPHLPPLAPAITTPVIPPLASPPLAAPLPTAPPVAAPVTPAAPAAPAAVVRFRCEVAPQEQACRDPGAAPDGGGGDDSECSCSRDYCYYTESGTQICEKY
jgi:hypothetical protein